ncbi:hypothetical protein [Plantactinospora soyae]|uniref:Uncharacterized protein n=1 Tax=Plantactinospora soyae TaxID=1544732 RepID=A0A927M8U3_9ACTN|nr:hypothetical protein [Plantactinospora soyae]MBE1489934.1 hypothetical protein [Plantactinospora soyae]
MAYRADPEVVGAQASARVPQLREPTLAAGETLADIRAEEIEMDSLTATGTTFERLDQLAMQHLLGVR